MKAIILLFLYFISISTQAQNIQQLEDKPSFKGIRIGMPISEISDKLSFERETNGYDVYRVTDKFYYSVFGVAMNYVRVVELDEKVHAIEAMKIVKICNDKLKNASDKVNKILTESGNLEDFTISEDK